MMRSTSPSLSIALLVLVLGAFAVTYASDAVETIQADDQSQIALVCSALSNGGYSYNLTALMNQAFTVMQPGTTTATSYQYTIRVCSAMVNKCANLTGVASCQAWGNFGTQSNMKSCGLYSAMKVTYQKSGQGLVINYSGGSNNRETNLNLNCGTGTDTSQWTLINQGYVYNFTLSHKAACGLSGSGSGSGSGSSSSSGSGSGSSSGSSSGSGHKKKSSSSSSKGLSGGSIFLIVLACVTVTYFVGGILFMKFVKKAEGKDIVPNVNFWTALPGLFKDGIVFTVTKIKGLICRGGNTSYQQV